MTVGNFGNGILNIASGGLVSDSCSGCSAAVIGYYAGASGTVSVSGSGSTWNNNGGPVNVGYLGNGSLTIDHGGQASAGVLLVGGGPGTSGTISIATGGQLITTGTAFIGGNGGIPTGPDPPRSVRLRYRTRARYGLALGLTLARQAKGR